MSNTETPAGWTFFIVSFIPGEREEFCLQAFQDGQCAVRAHTTGDFEEREKKSIEKKEPTFVYAKEDFHTG